MNEKPPYEPSANAPEPTYREIAAGLSGHCCFAGCTLVTCGFCHQPRCVYDLHLCAPEDGTDARPSESSAHFRSGDPT